MNELILDILSEKFTDLHFQETGLGLVANVPHWNAREVCQFCHDSDDLQFDYLNNYTAVDKPPDKIVLYAQLFSYTHKHKLTLMFKLDRNEPKLLSMQDIWKAANWYEREMYDLMGVIFPGHPDLRRIFLPDEWKGHPLRKDYQDDRLLKNCQVNCE